MIGAVALAQLAHNKTGKVVAGLVVTAAVAFSAVAAPMALPILSPPVLAAYMHRIGVEPQKQERSFKGTALPQVFADRLGRGDFVRQVAAAWSRIPAAERAATSIKVDNTARPLRSIYTARVCPPYSPGTTNISCGGLRGQNPRDVLVVQDNLAALRPYCRRVTLLGTTWSRYAMTYENGKVIALCQGVMPTLVRLWPKLKNYS